MADFDDYRESFANIAFRREDGVLELMIHDGDGGAAKWTSYKGGLHGQLGDAFYALGRDRENRCIILTGAGDSYLTAIDFSVRSPDSGTTSYWDRIYKEGKDLLQNLLEIEVPVIAAVNGPAWIHAEILTLSDVVLASDKASFADKAHFIADTAPADGVHVWWPMLLGPNRGRAFLITGDEIGAEEAKALGFVHEIVPHDRLRERAWAMARGIAARPDKMLRYTRVALTQHIKRRMLDDLGYGLQLEGMGILSRLGK